MLGPLVRRLGLPSNSLAVHQARPNTTRVHATEMIAAARRTAT